MTDSSESSLPSPANRPNAAAASPRTPTGRLQPKSAFRQWNPNSLERQPGNPPSESAARQSVSVRAEWGAPIPELVERELSQYPAGIASPSPPESTPLAASPPEVAPPEVSPPDLPASASASPAEAVGAVESRSAEPEHEEPTPRRRRSTGSSGADRQPTHRSSSGRSRVTGASRVPRRDSSSYADLAAIDLESAAVAGSSFRELSGLLLAFGLSILLTQASLWWLVGVDPLGLAPLVSHWMPGVVPPDLRP